MSEMDAVSRQLKGLINAATQSEKAVWRDMKATYPDDPWVDVNHRFRFGSDEERKAIQSDPNLCMVGIYGVIVSRKKGVTNGQTQQPT